MPKFRYDLPNRDATISNVLVDSIGVPFSSYPFCFLISMQLGRKTEDIDSESINIPSNSFHVLYLRGNRSSYVSKIL